jgi:hypothetical protein
MASQIFFFFHHFLDVEETKVFKQLIVVREYKKISHY